MTKMTPAMQFKNLYDINLNLVALVRQEKWDEFIEQAERYVIALHDVTKMDCRELSSEDKKELKALWQELLRNEDEIVKKLTSRMGVLGTEMAMLSKGRKCSQAYFQQMKSFH